MESKSVIIACVLVTILHTVTSFSYQPPAYRRHQGQSQRPAPVPVPVVPVPVRSSSSQYQQPQVKTVEAKPVEPIYRGKSMMEAEIIALEASGFIVPVMPLVQKIMRDLRAIRTHYKQVQDITVKSKWVPGEVFLRGKISQDAIDRIDASVYGPLENVKKYTFGTVLVFKKPYHPEVLSERLCEKFNVKAEPNTSVVPNGNGVIAYNQKEGVYTFEKGPGQFSYPGYSSNYVYKFQVKGDDVKLRSVSSPGTRL